MVMGMSMGEKSKKKPTKIEGREDVTLVGEEFLKKRKMRVDSTLSNSPETSRKMRTEISVVTSCWKLARARLAL